MSFVSKILPVMLTLWSVAAQAQTSPYSASVIEDPNSRNYIKTNIVVAPGLVETHFGDKSQWVLGGGTGANVYGTHDQIIKGREINEPDAFLLSLNVMGGQFVAKDFLLGMQGNIASVINNGAGKSLNTSVGPLAAYNVRMNQNVSFLPTLAVLYDYGQVWNNNDKGSHNHGIGIDVGLNFSFNVIRHLNVLVGPYVKQGVFSHVNTHDALGDVGSDGALRTSYGVRASILGWR